MAHEVKRSKTCTDLCPSDLSSSSLTNDRCSLAADVNDKKMQEYVLGFSTGEQVFGIDWILEEILHYVIYDNQQNVSTKQINNMRLVQKSWLSTTTKLLQKCGDPPPLIQLTLDNIFSYDFDPTENMKENKKKLDQFIATFGSSTRLEKSFLPFKLKLDSDFFRYEHFQSLSDCFTHFGGDLLELEIIYPLDGGNMPVYFPPLHFPILRKLAFQFSGNFHFCCGDEIYNFEDNRFGLWLLQSILNATKDLQQLDLPFQEDDDEDMVPATFEYLLLPRTIVSLKLELEFESKTLEIFFLRNQFPNLTHLTVRLHEKPYVEGLMYKILEHCRHTLVKFEVDGQRSNGRPHARTYFRFPLMEKLEHINIYSTECELESTEQLTCLQEYLPKLENISLQYQTEAMLKKWIENSKLENVKELSIAIINENLSEGHKNYVRSPTMETMTLISEAFSNVNDLFLQLNIGFLNVLECLFKKMYKVQLLELQFFGNFQRSSSNLLDSIFTGIPLGLVGSLKENSVDTLQTVVVLANGGQSSIRNLTKLTTLTLWTKDKSEDDEQVSLSSDLLFGQAFMKMSKLRKLYLHGKFQPSVSIQKKWKEQGRFIKYSA